MRPFLTSVFLATLGFATVASAQSLAEHAAAAAGATLGTAAGKPVSNALTNILGQVDQTTAAAAGSTAATAKTPAQIAAEKRAEEVNHPGSGSTNNPAAAALWAPSTVSAGRPVSRRSQAVAPKTVPRYVAPQVVEQPVKDVTAEDLANIKIGATGKELQAALGVPESHVSIPGDGHLLESCQYWAQGKQVGTVRLDNGQVVKVEIRNQ